jgi:choline dehydrogenase-like flavoprotein
VLASRLSEDPSVSVLVLEKGKVIDDWLSRVPIASEDYRRPLSQAVQRTPEPVAAIDNRHFMVWCAEALGGTSRINGKLVTRGIPAGYNEWADMGHSNWSWDKVEPYFKKSETALDHPNASYRGHDGTSKEVLN